MEHRRINFVGDDYHVDPLPTESFEPPRKRGRVFFVIFLVLVLFIGGCTAFAMMGKSSSNNPTDYDLETLEPKKPESLLKRLSAFVFSKDVELAGEKEDRINVLLLGMGGAGHDGPYLTDTIIIGSIKPSTNQIAMISIPRDLGVDIPGYGWQKINHANAYGESEKPNWGAAFATQVIEKTFDIDIQYYARIDFKAFRDIVDDVGGVTVNVERSFVDTEYPAPGDLYKTVSFKKGVQEMDGATALTFARSRHGNNGEGSDFARSKRQQKILLALKQKLFAASTILNPVKINSVITSLDKHLTTNMEFADIMTFVRMGKDIDTQDLIRLTIDSSPDGFLENGYTRGGAFILTPKTGNFDEIKAAIKYIFEAPPTEDIVDNGNVAPPKTTASIQREVVNDDTPEQTPPPLASEKIEVLNGTWQAGLAARTKKRLEDKRLNINHIGNTTERPVQKSGIYIVSNAGQSEVTDALKDMLDIPLKEKLTVDAEIRSDTDVVVILGEDFEE